MPKENITDDLLKTWQKVSKKQEKQESNLKLNH